jgi:glycosyl transferase family 25
LSQPAALIPVMVLSLVRATDRRARIHAELDSLGIPFSFFDATDGRALDPQEIAGLAKQLDARPIARDNFRPWLPGELTHMASFRGMLAAIANGNDEFVCVLEDDALVRPVFKDFMNKDVLCALPSFDVLRLQSSWVGRHLPLARVGDIEVSAPYRMGPQSFAQIFSRTAARFILPRTIPAHMPFDLMLYMDHKFPGLRILDVSPAVAIHGLIDSSIDEHMVRGKPAKLTPLQKLRIWLFRTGCKFRVYTGLARAWGIGARRKLRQRAATPSSRL